MWAVKKIFSPINIFHLVAALLVRIQCKKPILAHQWDPMQPVRHMDGVWEAEWLQRRLGASQTQPS